MNKRKNILVCRRVRYFSKKDEDAFLEWVYKITCIKDVYGEGDGLYLYFKSKNISNANLRNLIGLFYRYNVAMKQLQVFLNDRNKEWFYGRPNGFWHKKVFGG